MKWIVNPYLIDKMRKSEFSIICISQQFFGNYKIPEYAYLGIDFRLYNFSHIENFISNARYISSGIDDESSKAYLNFMFDQHANTEVSCIKSFDETVTLITFEPKPLIRSSIDVYLLFVQREEGEDEDMVTVDTPNETYIPDTRIRGLIQSKIAYSFDVSKLTIGHPYRIRFLGDIDIFDKHYKYNDEIYSILAEATEEDLKFATIHDNVSNIGSAISSAFQLKPDMKFELDKLV